MRRYSAAFTLIEVLIVVSIVAVLAVIGTPSLVSTITSTRMSGDINGLVSALNFARSEAIKRGLTVSVCPGSGTTCGTGTDWTSGWIVLASDTTPKTLFIGQALAHGETLGSNTATSPAYPQFTSAGYTFFSGKLVLHDVNSTPSLTRCIVFSAGSWVPQTTDASCS